MALMAAAGSPSSLEKRFHRSDNPFGVEFTRIVLHASNAMSLFQEKSDPSGSSSDNRHKIAILYLYFFGPHLSSKIGFMVRILSAKTISIIHHAAIDKMTFLK
jgi:hypothetical protein